MRSRYTAFALEDAGYLLQTWNPRTRPTALELDPGVRWIGLEIIGHTGGGPFERIGTVEFCANFVLDSRRGQSREHSRFLRDDQRWTYLGAI